MPKRLQLFFYEQNCFFEHSSYNARRKILDTRREPEHRKDVCQKPQKICCKVNYPYRTVVIAEQQNKKKKRIEHKKEKIKHENRRFIFENQAQEAKKIINDTH